MRSLLVWSDQIPDNDNTPPSIIWSVVFKPGIIKKIYTWIDGSELVVAVSNRVLVYDSASGELLHSLPGINLHIFINCQ